MESATGLLYINVGIDRGRHDPRRRPLLRRRPAGMRSATDEQERSELDPRRRDLDWIESLAAAAPAGARGDRGRRRAARRPDRRPRRRAGPVGPGRRPAADRRGRHGVRLLDAVDGARPAGRRHDRDHRPGPRADGPRPRLVARRPASPTSGSRSSRPALDAFASRRSGPRRAVRPGLHRRAQARVRRLPRGARRPRLAPGALVVADNVLWSGRVVGRRAGRGRRREHGGPARLRRGASSATRGSPPRSCPSATACSSRPGAAERAAGDAVRVRVRLFAIQRELAGTREVALDLADGRDGRGRLDGARGASTRSSRPAAPSVRFARNGDYADADDASWPTATRWR